MVVVTWGPYSMSSKAICCSSYLELGRPSGSCTFVIQTFKRLDTFEANQDYLMRLYLNSNKPENNKTHKSLMSRFNL